MKMHIYGPGGENSPTVLIIHPMLSSASSMKASLCDHMGPGLRFLVPDLSAHGDEASAPYVSAAAAEAGAIHEWLTSWGMRRLSLGFAASLGGVILFELLRFPDLSFDRLFIEGVSFYSGGPVARVGGSILSRVMVAKHRKAVRDCSHVSLPPLSPTTQRHCTFAYGEKDSDLRLARRVIPRLYPEVELRVWPGWGHCERMSRDSVAYGAMLRNVALGSASTDRS